MKKMFALLCAIGLFSVTTHSFAQDSTKVRKARVKKAVTTATTKANNAVTTTTTKATTVPATATTKAATVKTAATTRVATVKTTAAQTAAAAKVTDKVVSTDAKGRTIYQGPKGGQYYINASGTKEYIKKM